MQWQLFVLPVYSLVWMTMISTIMWKDFQCSCYGKNATDGSFFLQLNDSTTLLPTNMSSSPFGDKEVRALVNYDEVSESGGRYDKAVQVNWIDMYFDEIDCPV